MQLEIYALQETDRAWTKSFLEEQVGAAHVVSQGTLHQADRKTGYVGLANDTRVGLLTYHIANDELEYEICSQPLK